MTTDQRFPILPVLRSWPATFSNVPQLCGRCRTECPAAFAVFLTLSLAKWPAGLHKFISGLPQLLELECRANIFEIGHNCYRLPTQGLIRLPTPTPTSCPTLTPDSLKIPLTPDSRLLTPSLYEMQSRNVQRNKTKRLSLCWMCFFSLWLTRITHS